MVQKVDSVKKSKTPQQAQQSLMRLCARSERCAADALRLMRGWGVAESEAQKILQYLLRERFIDDSRYAAAFVREKINLSSWGRAKIVSALRAKSIATETISQALEQMSETDIEERLKRLLLRKMRTVKAKNSADLRNRLFRYAASQGYDFSVIRDVVESCVKDEEGCEYFD